LYPRRAFEALGKEESMVTTTPLMAVDRVGEMVIVTPLSDLMELAYQEIEATADPILAILSDPSMRKVVVDFHRTDYFGSTALGLFIRLWKRVSERKGRMAFCNLSANERDILQVTKLDRLWPVCESREEAVQLVSKGTPWRSSRPADSEGRSPCG
jgi:anti-anti-sigma factor